MRPHYRVALQKSQDDPLVQEMVQELRWAHKYQRALRKNLVDQTTAEALWLEEAARESLEAYEHDPNWFIETLQNAIEVANELEELDDQADDIIDYLDEVYNTFVEAEWYADQKGYPDNHPIFKLMDLLDELLGTELD